MPGIITLFSTNAQDAGQTPPLKPVIAILPALSPLVTTLFSIICESLHLGMFFMKLKPLLTL